MSDLGTTETTEKAEEVAAEDEVVAAGMTVERAADTVLGALVSAAEAVEAAVKLVQENGPAVAEAWEKKGRPVRERIVEALRGTPLYTPTSPDTSAGSGGGSTGGKKAEEISALERRVRELEAQIAGGDLQIEETTAEAATFNGEVWETPEERDSLADSPYAVSETPEEQAKEAADGESDAKPKPRSRKKPVE